MGIVKIGDALHEELRKSSSVMCRSINAQAEFWIKVGMLAEANPTVPFTEIMALQLKNAEVQEPTDRRGLKLFSLSGEVRIG